MRNLARLKRAAERLRPEDFLYPERDGTPVGETDDHRDELFYLVEALKLWFLGQKAYVSGDLMMYWIPGNANRSVSPDVFVVKGVEQRHRRVYKVWEEGRAPDVVIEITSADTRLEDLRGKFDLYQDVLEVKEYYIHDPHREWIDGRMRAWELRAGKFVEREIVAGRIHSRRLGLDLVARGSRLRLVDPATGRTLPSLVEAAQQAEQAQAQAEQAQALAQQAQARAEAEAAARARAEAELRRLRARLRRRGGAK